MSLFCKHDYNVISEITTKSPIEVAKENGMSITKGNGYLFDRKHIVILKCAKCNKIQRYVEEL